MKALTGDSAAKCSPQALCTAIMADPSLPLLLAQHEFVAAVVLMLRLVVE
jgi:hypothetical protein